MVDSFFHFLFLLDRLSEACSLRIFRVTILPAHVIFISNFLQRDFALVLNLSLLLLFFCDRLLNILRIVFFRVLLINSSSFDCLRIAVTLLLTLSRIPFANDRVLLVLVSQLLPLSDCIQLNQDSISIHGPIHFGLAFNHNVNF